MTTSSNIIPFPAHDNRPACSPLYKVTAELPAICPVHSHFTRPLHETDEEVHVAAVVRASIHFARRKGVSLDSLPSTLRLWLLRQCERGEPTCLMVREWLTGNHRFLALADNGARIEE